MSVAVGPRQSGSRKPEGRHRQVELQARSAVPTSRSRHAGIRLSENELPTMDEVDNEEFRARVAEPARFLRRVANQARALGENHQWTPAGGSVAEQGNP